MRESDEPERPILVAPDAFKGTFTAPEVAEALAAGIRARGGSPMTAVPDLSPAPAELDRPATVA